MAEIWREVLGIDVLGIEENFFDLGGHSLLVTQVLSRVKYVFQIELPVRCLFENPTVEVFAARITEAQQERRGVPDAPIVPLPREGELPLSYSQERMWFLNQLESFRCVRLRWRRAKQAIQSRTPTRPRARPTE